MTTIQLPDDWQRVVERYWRRGNLNDLLEVLESRRVPETREKPGGVRVRFSGRFNAYLDDDGNVYTRIGTMWEVANEFALNPFGDSSPTPGESSLTVHGTTETAELHFPTAFDVSHGRWRITGTYAPEDNITIYRDGELYRRTTFPAYKIWNIPAHLGEHAEELDREVGDATQAEPALHITDTDRHGMSVNRRLCDTTQAEGKRCTCEYIDVGIGLQRANPDPDCPEHDELMNAVERYRNTGDVIKCSECGQQTRSISAGCSNCGVGRAPGDSPGWTPTVGDKVRRVGGWKVGTVVRVPEHGEFAWVRFADLTGYHIDVLNLEPAPSGDESSPYVDDSGGHREAGQ